MADSLVITPLSGKIEPLLHRASLSEQNFERERHEYRHEPRKYLKSELSYQSGGGLPDVSVA